MARKTGKPANAAIVTNAASAKNPIVNAGLPGDPEIDAEAP